MFGIYIYNLYTYCIILLNSSGPLRRQQISRCGAAVLHQILEPVLKRLGSTAHFPGTKSGKVIYIYILLYIHYVRRQQFLFCIRINVCCESMYDLIPHTIQLLRIPANDEQCIVCVQLDNSQVPLSCESM